MAELEFVKWNYLKIATIALFGLVLILLPINPIISYIVLLFLVGTWSRIPAMTAEILMDLEICDVLTVIVAINMGSLEGGLFGFLVIWFSRIFGPLEDIRATRTESIAFLVGGLLTPFIYSITGNVLFTVYAFSVIRYTTVLIVVKLLSPLSVFYYVLIECLIAAPLGFFINTLTEGLLGDFTNNLFKTGLSFDWGLFVFVGIIVLFFIIGKRAESWMKQKMEEQAKKSNERFKLKLEKLPIVKNLIEYGFSFKELTGIVLSAFSLAIILSLFESNILTAFFTMFFIVILTLFLKISAQKIAAKKYDCYTEYKFDYRLFFLSLILALLSNNAVIFPIMGFIAISPAFYARLGHKFSKITKKEQALIALSGPLINIIISLIALLLNPLSPAIFNTILKINLFMALFSLLPIPPLEGAKIIWWSRLAWLTSFLITLFLLFFGFNILFAILGIILVIIITFVLWHKL